MAYLKPQSPPSSPPYVKSSSPVAAGGSGESIEFPPGAPRKQVGCLALKGTYVFGEIDGEKQKLTAPSDFYNVLSIFQKLSTKGDGCTIEQVAACAAELPSSKHMSKEKILIITNELELDGHIYSTLNDSTFKTTGPLAQPEPHEKVDEDEHEHEKGEEDEDQEEVEKGEAEDDEEDNECLLQRIKLLSQENAALKKQRDELMRAHVEKNKWFSKLLKGFKEFKEVVAVAAEDAKDEDDAEDEEDEKDERPKKRGRRS